MPASSTAATMVFALRIAYGAALMLTPDRLTKRWLGPGGRQPAARVALRGLGAREVVLHAGGLVAARRGKPIRPWIAASIAGDVVDILATAAGREGLPEQAAPATLAVAGASAVLSAAIGVAADS
ncbi:MAG: hypothetical protein ACR2ML_14225 [Solirubrobacteraceae bacterium]